MTIKRLQRMTSPYCNLARKPPAGGAGNDARRRHDQRHEVRFPPLANLFGGKPRVFYVRVLPQEPGDAKVRAQLTQRGSSQPILVDTVTQILP